MRKVKLYFGRCRPSRGLKRIWPRLYGPTIIFFEPSPEYRATVESWIVPLPKDALIDHTVDAFAMSRGIDCLNTYQGNMHEFAKA